MHPSTFIQEEMDARGWDRTNLAVQMGGDAGMNLLCLDMYFIVGPTALDLILGDDTASQLAVAFDVSAAYFLGLEKSWRDAE